MRLFRCVFVVIAASGAGLGGLDPGAAGAGGERFHAPKPPQMPSQPVFHMPSQPQLQMPVPPREQQTASPILRTISTQTQLTPGRRTKGPLSGGGRISEGLMEPAVVSLSREPARILQSLS